MLHFYEITGHFCLDTVERNSVTEVYRSALIAIMISFFSMVFTAELWIHLLMIINDMTMAKCFMRLEIHGRK